MNKTLSETILMFAAKDENVRNRLIREGELFEGYHPEMERLHKENAEILSALIDESGWPGQNQVGAAASRAAWMVVQHAIGQPLFQKRCLKLLKEEADEGRFDRSLVAMLEDRIAFFEGRPQIYGTQFDWDDEGRMSPYQIEDSERVDQLRQSVGLPQLSVAIAEMRQRADADGNRPPKNPAEKKKRFEEWLRQVGWR